MKKIFLFGLGLVFSFALLPSSVLAALSAPTPLSPSNGASSYNVNVTNLYWTKLPEVTGYNLRFKAGDSNFGNLVPVDLGLDNYKLVSALTGVLNDGRTYYWQVQARKGSATSSWSTIYKFTTAKVPEKATTLSSGGSVISKNSPRDFSWKVDRQTLFSKVIIYSADQSTGTCGVNILINQKTKELKISSNILMTLDPGKYCWTVQACGNVGCAVEATKMKFSLNGANLVPGLIFASSGFGSTIFYWEKFTDEATTVQVSKSAAFPTGNNTVEVTGLTTNYLMSSSAPTIFKNFLSNNIGVDLYWRVGTNGVWAKYQKFKQPFLTKPVLIYPATGATNFIATSSTFRWGTVKEATFYKMEIIGGAGTKVYYSSTPSYKMPINPAQGALAKNTNYTWRVTAYNDLTESQVSSGFSFITK